MLFIVPLLFVALSATTLAANQTNLIPGAEQIQIDAQLWQDGQRINHFEFLAPQDHKTTVNATTDFATRLGNVTDGFTLTLTPTLTATGKIRVEVHANQSVVQFRTLGKGKGRLELPETSSSELNQVVFFNDRKEATLSLGALPAKSSAPYTLKLYASKI